MAIADPSKLWPKLEKDGVVEVRKKLAMGVYAKYKVPVIREWLVNKKNEQNQPTDKQLDVEEFEPSKELRNRFLKYKYILIEFWSDHWKWIIGAVIVPIFIAKFLL